MLPRLLFVIVCIGVMGATLLALRQQRLLMMHEMAQLHVQMDRDRKATWQSQSIIAEATHPLALREALDRVELDLEPMPSVDPTQLPGPALMPYQSRVAELPAQPLPITPRD